MKEINWAFHTGHEFRVDHPEAAMQFIDSDFDICIPLLKDIMHERKGIVYRKCPAVTDFFKNAFVFRSPMDLNIDIKINNDNDMYVYCDNINQDFFDKMIDIRFLDSIEKGNSPYPLIGIDFLNTFTSKESTILQTLPAFLHYNDFTRKAKVIPGEYDISKWVRPVEIVFEVENKNETIKIKKGDALAYFKFLYNEPIKLVKSNPPWEDIVGCNTIRDTNKFRPLNERYESYADWKKSNV